MSHPSGNCRFCSTPLAKEFANLRTSPPSNAYLRAAQLLEPEVFYPLVAFVCEKCLLVQVPEFKKHDEIFTDDYAYFSSYSECWLNHCKKYVDSVLGRFPIGPKSHVVEIASNDGYLLQYFHQKGIPVLGIEPTANTAKVAREKGINTLVDFFTTKLAAKLKSESKQADLIVANNVLAHVPDVKDFVAGLKTLLKPDGFITIEFPHLLNLVELNQFDTIYHEHYSYFSFLTVNEIFKSVSLEIFDVEKLDTHGGSLRIYVKHQNSTSHKNTSAVSDLLSEEREKRYDKLDRYEKYQDKVESAKDAALEFLLEQKKLNKKVIAYGAAAKGNTFLNYAGISKDLISCVIDRAPSKFGKFLPGSHIPILNPDEIPKIKPDVIVILAWNIKDEVMQQLSFAKQWNAKFATFIPDLQVHE